MGLSRIVWRTGAGSARPVVSTMTRSKSGTAPAARLVSSPSRVAEKIAVQCAAQAALGQQHDFSPDRLDQRVIEPHLAELVDDHRRIYEPRVAQKAADQCRLAAAEESGHD